MLTVNREQLIEGMKESTLFLDKVANISCLGRPNEINDLLKIIGEEEVAAKYEVGVEYFYRAWPFVLNEENGEKFYFLANDIGNTHYNYICELTHNSIMNLIYEMNAEKASEMLAEQREMVNVFSTALGIDQDNLKVFEKAITAIQSHFEVVQHHSLKYDFTTMTAYDVWERLNSYKQLVEISEHVGINEDVLKKYQKTLDNLIKCFECLSELARLSMVHNELNE